MHFADLRSRFQFNYLRKKVSTRKKKNHQKRQLIQLNETLNDFIFGNNTNASAIGNETVEPQTIGCFDDF